MLKFILTVKAKVGAVEMPTSSVAQWCLNLWDLWSVAYQAPLSMGLPARILSELPFYFQGDLPNPGI